MNSQSGDSSMIESSPLSDRKGRTILERSEPRTAVLHHRADIDGLRALAIIPVVAFHAGCRWVSGGFVGVDVFFVISGFLITSIIIGEIRQGQFSFVAFYERRIRRIFPALFFMLFVCSVVAARVLLPSDFYSYGRSVFAAVTFFSNFLFWLQAGYFDAPSASKPLLHTWSLAVEEQYYIFFPVFLILISQWLKGRYTLVLGAMVIVSFLLSAWGIYHKPSSTFYLLPTRAWELLLGSLLALRVLPTIRATAVREASAASGLFLILCSVFFLTSKVPFPGINALPSCLGTALIIYAGEGGDSSVGRLLSTPLFVFPGLVSYSLYLWHWPTLLFFRYLSIDALTSWQTLLAVLVATGLALFSLKFVEEPFRRKKLLATRPALFAAAAAVTFGGIVFSIWASSDGGQPLRFPTEVSDLAAFSKSFNPRRTECFDRSWLARPAPCTFGNSRAAPTWAVWGDSYADAMIDPIGQLASLHRQSVVFYGRSSCPPIYGFYREGEIAEDCVLHNDAAMKALLESSSVKNVILIARFALYIEGRVNSHGLIEEGSDVLIKKANGGPLLSDKERQALFKEELSRTVDLLLAAHKRVFLFYPIPEAYFSVPETLAKIVRAGRDPNAIFVSFDSFKERNSFVLDTLDSLPHNEQVVRIFAYKALCKSTRCKIFADGKPLYRDGSHLSQFGAVKVLQECGFESYFIALSMGESRPSTHHYDQQLHLSAQQDSVRRLDRLWPQIDLAERS